VGCNEGEGFGRIWMCYCLLGFPLDTTSSLYDSMNYSYLLTNIL
jgi:hypothetical protein